MPATTAQEDSEDSTEPPSGGDPPGFYGNPPGSHGHTSFSPQSPEFETKAIPSLNQDKQTTPILYCICGDSQWDSAMIECHNCHKYFHGSCVGISRLKAALLKCFYCPLCIDGEPELVTEFGTRVEQKPVEGKGEGGARKLKNKRHSRR